MDATAEGSWRLTAVNRNEDLARQCQRRRLRLRNGDSVPYAAVLSPRTSLRVRSTEDEDSPERATAVRSPRPVGERAAERCSRARRSIRGVVSLKPA